MIIKIRSAKKTISTEVHCLSPSREKKFLITSNIVCIMLLLPIGSKLLCDKAFSAFHKLSYLTGVVTFLVTKVESD
jgi:hypothetical protein